MSVLYFMIGFLLQDKCKTAKLTNKIRKVLVINLQGMGDILMTTPLIHDLAKNNCVVNVLVGGVLQKEVLKNNDDVHMAEVINKARKTIQVINQNKYDAIILANGAGPKSGLFFLFLNARHKLCHRYNLGGFLTGFKANTVLTQTEGMHRVEENSKFIKALKFKPSKEQKYHYKLNKESIKKVNLFWKENKLTKKKVIGIHPGGDKANPKKRYPLSKLLNFTNELHSKEEALFFIGPDEKELQKEIQQELPAAKFFQGTIHETAAALSKCTVLIHSDSGLGHLAAALDVPTRTIVGPTNWNRTKPYSSQDKLIKNPNNPKPTERKMEEGFIRTNNFLFPERINRKDVF